MLRGWFGYFKHATPALYGVLLCFVRRRLGAILRKQDKRPASDDARLTSGAGEGLLCCSWAVHPSHSFRAGDTLRSGNRRLENGMHGSERGKDAALKPGTTRLQGKQRVASTDADVYVEAATSIQLHVGASTLTMDKGGKVQIKANDIILDAKAISLSGQTSVETVGGQVTQRLRGRTRSRALG
jgi:hypothetical protein